MPRGAGGGSVAGFPTKLFQIGNNADSGNSAVANKVNYAGFYLPAPLTFANLAVNIATNDAVNNSDLGIYAADGSALLANIGAQHTAATGIQTFAIVQTSVTLNPGRYLLAFTSAGSTFGLNKDNHWPSWCFISSGVGTSVGGALPASIPAPTLAINTAAPWILALYT